MPRGSDRACARSGSATTTRLEYIARAARDADAVARSNAMVVLGQPVILSLLVDRAGLVQGYRIITDPRADADLRMNAYTIGRLHSRRASAPTAGTATMLPPAEGETPIDGIFIKQRCRKVAEGAAGHGRKPPLLQARAGAARSQHRASRR